MTKTNTKTKAPAKVRAPKTQLLNADRDAIRDAIIHHKYPNGRAEVTEATQKLGHALARECYDLAYDKPMQKLMAKLPEQAFKRMDDFYVNAGGWRLIMRLPGGESRPFFYGTGNAYYTNQLDLPLDSELCLRLRAHSKQVEAEREAAQLANKQLKATLAQFRSFDDLLEAWPDARQFIVARWQERPDYKANVPVVQLKDLSKVLGLPPKTEGAGKAKVKA